MFQANLVYTSRAVVEVNPKLVAALAEQAAMRNRELAITGMLISGGGRFLQVLEGERKQLTRLYAKIANDERHTDCTLLLHQDRAPRRFPDFHMGHLSVGEPNVSDAQAWDDLCRRVDKGEPANRMAIDPVLALVREFIARFGESRHHRAHSA